MRSTTGSILSMASRVVGETSGRWHGDGVGFGRGDLGASHRAVGDAVIRRVVVMSYMYGLNKRWISNGPSGFLPPRTIPPTFKF